MFPEAEVRAVGVTSAATGWAFRAEEVGRSPGPQHLADAGEGSVDPLSWVSLDVPAHLQSAVCL